MAIRANANYVTLVLQNLNRETATPPVVFPDLTPDARFSWSIWVRPFSNIPYVLTGYNGTDGSQVVISHNGFVWQISARSGTLFLFQQNFALVTPGRWALICVTKTGPTTYVVYYGMQDTDPNPWERQVDIVAGAQVDYPINSPLQSFVINVGADANLSSFKFWNSALTEAELQVQTHRWDAQTGGAGAAPMWVSPLRVPGDISNIANPYASANWDHGHAFNEINPISGLLYGGEDPAYLAISQPCPAWVHPFTPFSHCFVDAGLSPLVKTTYKAIQFFQFQDVGAVPIVDFEIQSITYFGLPFSGPNPGWAHSETWALFKDETGAEVSDTTNTIYKFEPDTLAATPIALKASNMYKWQFGAQFVYNATTPQQQTARANLSYLMLYVIYTGQPSGVTFIPATDLAGLFALNKSPGPNVLNTDIYNNGVELKIPNPTIRTAYIGE